WVRSPQVAEFAIPARIGPALTDLAAQPPTTTHAPALTTPRPSDVPPPLHGEVGVRRFFSLHATAAIFPLSGGLMLFGWRAMLTVALVVGGAALGLAVWKRVGLRGSRIGIARGLWLALLLALTLPAHLA